MEKSWVYKKPPETEEEKSIIANLIDELKIEPTLALLLWQRGVKDFNSAKFFFRPNLTDLHDPFLMKDMEIAVKRLEKAIAEGEEILIYGDYDVDGTTSVALVYGFLSKFYDKLDYYTPDRYLEGYGVSKAGIEYAAENKISLIIALDCGIKSVQLIQWAKETYQIDFIVCDHHEPGEVLPPAIAILDPKRKDCGYPFKELSGNGVGFKLLTAYSLKNNIPLEILFDSLDLAMVSIASDIVPILGENRILAHFGLKKMNEEPKTGLKALKEVAGFQGDMSIESVVFTLGPRINAAGRIFHAKAAVELLLEEDYTKAVEMAHGIQAYNTERRTLDSTITEEALAQIENNDWIKKAKSTVLFNENWNKGVIGIVASRIIEHYHKPTVIFTKTKDGFAAGSARSVPGFDLYNAIEQSSEFLEQFGGHKHAAGMTIAIEKIDLFRKKFDEVVSSLISDQMLIPEIIIDTKLPISSINNKFYRIMRQMAPFGPQNLQPVFMSEGLKLASLPLVLKEKHLKLELLEPETGVTMTALGFNMMDQFLKLFERYDLFDAVYTLEINNFRGISTLQLFLKDLKFKI